MSGLLYTDAEGHEVFIEDVEFPCGYYGTVFEHGACPVCKPVEEQE